MTPKQKPLRAGHMADRESGGLYVCDFPTLSEPHAGYEVRKSVLGEVK